MHSDALALCRQARTLVYHRFFLTQIEIFRFIRIRFVFREVICWDLLRATLDRTAQFPWKEDHDSPFRAVQPQCDPYGR